MPDSWNLEWLNANSQRAFPFKEDVSRQDVNGLAVIPNSLLVDLVFVLPAGTSYRYYLKTLMYSGAHLTLVLADETGATIATLTVDLTTHTTNKAYTLQGEGNFSGAVGRLCLGNTSSLDAQLPRGVYNFALTTAEFELRTVRPDLRAVYSLAVVGADGAESDKLTGIVRLLAGQNVRLTYIPAAGLLPAGIRIDAVNNDDYEEDCGCSSSVAPPAPLRSINGVTGTSGRVDLISGSPCLQIAVVGNKLQLTDKCSEPCCGCAEIEFLTDRLQLLQDTIDKIEALQNELSVNEREFYQNVLESLK